MSHPLSSSRYALVIFDCDGVLIDSEPIANRVFRDQLAAVGLDLPIEKVMGTFVGNTKDGCIELAGRMLGRPLPPDFGDRWDRELFVTLRAEVKPVEGIPDLLASMRIPYCVASNGNRDRMQLALEAAGLLRFVDGRIIRPPRSRGRSPHRISSCTRRRRWAPSRETAP